MTSPVQTLDRSLFREVLTARTSAEDWTRWFKDLHVSVTASGVVVEAPSQFVANQVVNRFLPEVESAARSAGGRHAVREVHVKVNPSPSRSESHPPSPIRGGDSRPVAKSPPSPVHPTNLHRFDNFEVDRSSQFAFAAAQAVTDYPGQQYNPLFIYASVGLGKTHLLHAIAHAARQTRPGMEILYSTSEQFVQDFVRSVNKRQMQRFRKKFRQVDMLLVDDLQFLEGKEQTLEEFLWTLDSLQGYGKQIVLASDRGPSDLKNIGERVRSRISAGLITEITPPAIDTRLAILSRRQQNSAHRLEDEVLLLIAEHIPNNIRNLISAHRQLAAYSKLTSAPITPQTAVRQLAPISQSFSLPHTPESIMAVCAQAFDTTVEEILHRNRRPAPSIARQVAMYLARQITDLPFARIGQSFQRGHSTVITAHRKVLSRISHDSRFAERVTAIHKAIHNS